MSECIWRTGGLILREQHETLAQKPTLMPLCPLQTPHGLAWDWNQAATGKAGDYTPGQQPDPCTYMTTLLWESITILALAIVARTAELHLSGLNGRESHPNMQKIRIIGFFFENILYWRFEVRLLLFTVCTCVETFRLRLIWSSRSHNTLLYLFQYAVILRQVGFAQFSKNLPEGPSRSG
jgi:hypothetical protein